MLFELVRLAQVVEHVVQIELTARLAKGLLQKRYQLGLLLDDQLEKLLLGERMAFLEKLYLDCSIYSVCLLLVHRLQLLEEFIQLDLKVLPQLILVWKPIDETWISHHE